MLKGTVIKHVFCSILLKSPRSLKQNEYEHKLYFLNHEDMYLLCILYHEHIETRPIISGFAVY